MTDLQRSRNANLVHLAMLKDEWEAYVEKHGHPPTWHPHEKASKEKTMDTP